MIKPNKLKKGDKVAIVSLSSGIAGDKEFQHRYLVGKERLETEFGLEVIPMPNALLGSEKLKNSPKLRADDFMEAFKRKEIKAIFSNIGGDDTIRLLPYIDFNIIKENPKIFIGYSDSTINNFMLYKAGLVSFYGPTVMAEFAENVEMHEYTKKSLKKILFEDSKDYKILPSKEWTSESLSWVDEKNNKIKRNMNKEKHGYELLQGHGEVEGSLIGGCIDTFHMFIGSELWLNENEWKNKILFLETSEDNPEPEFIAQLLRNPLFEECLRNIKGLIIGKPMDEKYYDEYKEIYIDVISNEYGRKDLPIIYNCNFGHTDPMAIIPMGIKASINCEAKAIKLLESCVNDK